MAPCDPSCTHPGGDSPAQQQPSQTQAFQPLSCPSLWHLVLSQPPHQLVGSNLVPAPAQGQQGEQLQEPPPIPWLGSTPQVPVTDTADGAKQGTPGTNQAPSEVPQSSLGFQAPFPLCHVFRELFKQEERPSADRTHRSSVSHLPPSTEQHTWQPA